MHVENIDYDKIYEKKTPTNTYQDCDICLRGASYHVGYKTVVAGGI